MVLELDPKDLQILIQLVETRLRELGPEIHHTHTLAFREDLKELRRQLESLRERLAAA